MTKRNTFLSLSLGLSLLAFAGEPTPEPAKAPQADPSVGYYKTTCGIIVEGMNSGSFASIYDFWIYAKGINAEFCGEFTLPDYSANPFPPEPETETPD